MLPKAEAKSLTCILAIITLHQSVPLFIPGSPVRQVHPAFVSGWNSFSYSLLSGSDHKCLLSSLHVSASFYQFPYVRYIPSSYPKTCFVPMLCRSGLPLFIATKSIDACLSLYLCLHMEQESQPLSQVRPLWLFPCFIAFSVRVIISCRVVSVDFPA